MVANRGPDITGTRNATRFSDWVNVGVPHGTLEDRPSKCRRG